MSISLTWTVQFEICQNCKFASPAKLFNTSEHYCEKIYEAMPYIKSFMEEILKPETITGRSPKRREKPIFRCPIYQREINNK